MLYDIPLQRWIGRWKGQRLPPAGFFDGQTVLITGGTAGMGLAAAVHYASLGADVIITGRTQSRGEKAKQHIEEAAAKRNGKGKVDFMSLDMSRYASCTLFVDELKKRYQGRGGLDVVVLNAGSINSHFEKSPEGW